MPTFTGKTFASFYKNILGISQTSNTGVDATTRAVHDGAGNSSSVSLSDDVFEVQPNNTETDSDTSTFAVKSAGGSSILTTDTYNKRVLCGSSQINALTQYQYFASARLIPVAGYHYVLALGSGSYAGHLNEWNLGNGVNPALTFDVSASGLYSNSLVLSYWYLPDAITVNAVHVLMGGNSASTADNLNFQLYSYALDTSTNYGDLSDGTLVAGTVGAGGSFVSDVHEDAIKYQSLANTPTDIAAGRIILATVESTGTDNISINMTVKYHIQ